MSTYLKPSARFTTADWFTNNFASSTNSQRTRQSSHDVRQESRYLRNETDNRTKWDQLDNNMRLADRIDHIRRLKDLMERTVQTLDRELGSLGDAKECMEKWQERIVMINHINTENLVSREGRQDIDLVWDEVEDQLLKEKELLDAIKKQLQSKIDEAFEHLSILQEVRSNVLENLQNKNVSLDIDIEQYNTTDESAAITFKPDPCRVPNKMLTVQQWEDYCLMNQARSEAEIANSFNLRECIQQTLHQTQNDWESQNIGTLFVLRKRVHELEMALDEDKWQKKLTEEEMAEIEEEIKRLEEAIRFNNRVTKVAHTRLEKRLYRPGEEMCRDNVQFGIQDEVKQLDATLQALEDKKRQSQHALDCLEKNLHKLNKDIRIKTNSLHIDEQCIASRKKLESQYPPTTTEKDMAVVGGHGAREKCHFLPL